MKVNAGVATIIMYVYTSYDVVRAIKKYIVHHIPPHIANAQNYYMYMICVTEQANSALAFICT